MIIVASLLRRASPLRPSFCRRQFPARDLALSSQRRQSILAFIELRRCQRRVCLLPGCPARTGRVSRHRQVSLHHQHRSRQWQMQVFLGLQALHRADTPTTHIPSRPTHRRALPIIQYINRSTGRRKQRRQVTSLMDTSPSPKARANSRRMLGVLSEA